MDSQLPTSPDPTTAWLVDSSIYIFKAWYTWPDTLIDVEGNPVNAVLGFMEFVHTLLTKEQPAVIGFAFDQSLENSHRKQIYPAYKANRESAPDELKFQFRLCREFISALGIRHAASTRFEADDIIGTWASQARNRGQRFHIITGDKDLAQLIGHEDLWWEYGQNIQRNEKDIEKKFGVRPDQMADLLAIAGDASDNIPGVPGIGMVTAAKLLKKFDCIDNLLSRSPEIGQSKIRGARRLQGLIEEHRDTILLSRDLTAIVCNLAPDELQTDLQRRAPDLDALDQFLARLNLAPTRRKRWQRLLEKYESLQ
jgi:5'-3' exonuclease